MITATYYRDAGMGLREISATEFDDPLDAFEEFASHELGWGGRVTESTSRKVVVETRIMDFLDVTRFVGNKSEMTPLVRLAGANKPGLQVTDELVNTLARLPNEPDYVKVGSMVVGALRLGSGDLREAVARSLGFGDREVAAAAAHPVEHIVAAARIARDWKCEFMEALAL